MWGDPRGAREPSAPIPPGATGVLLEVSTLYIATEGNRKRPLVLSMSVLSVPACVALCGWPCIHVPVLRSLWAWACWQHRLLSSGTLGTPSCTSLASIGLLDLATSNAPHGRYGPLNRCRETWLFNASFYFNDWIYLFNAGVHISLSY